MNVRPLKCERYVNTSWRHCPRTLSQKPHTHLREGAHPQLTAPHRRRQQTCTPAAATTTTAQQHNNNDDDDNNNNDNNNNNNDTESTFSIKRQATTPWCTVTARPGSERRFVSHMNVRPLKCERYVNTSWRHCPRTLSQKPHTHLREGAPPRANSATPPPSTNLHTSRCHHHNSTTARQRRRQQQQHNSTTTTTTMTTTTNDKESTFSIKRQATMQWVHSHSETGLREKICQSYERQTVEM
jgi:hypothetical protein